VLAVNPLTLERWWLRLPFVHRDLALRVLTWDAVALGVAIALALFVARRGARGDGGPERRGGALALKLAAALLIGALTLELCLRLLVPPAALSGSLRRELRWRAQRAETAMARGARSNYVFSPTLGWELRANLRTPAITSNSAGLRGAREHRNEPETGTGRVLCVGDSFTFGAKLADADTMPARLEMELNRGPARPWEVLNLGVEGYGTDQQWLHLAEKGLRYRAHVVVLGFFEENLERNVRSFRDYAKPYFTLEGGRLSLRNTPVPSPEEILARRPPFPRFYLGSLLGGIVNEFRASISIGELADTRAGRVTLAILDAMREAVVSRGAAFVLMSIPRPILPRPSDTELLLARWAARTNTPLLNLRTAYLALPDTERHRLYRGHWTPEGAAVTARLVAGEVRQALATSRTGVGERPGQRGN
jgi:hypothetical protein